MDRTEFPQNQQTRCDGCSQITPSYEIVHYGSPERGYRLLCSHCFNTLVAELDGLDGFENARFEPVGLADCAGEVHQFHFRTRLFGPGVHSMPSSFATDLRPTISSKLSATHRTICSCCSGD